MKKYSIDEFEEYCKFIVSKYEGSDIDYIKDFVECCENCLETGDYSALLWDSKRKELINKYSWGIPSEEAIDVLVSESPIVEVGAGSGYWASIVNRCGGYCIAYDKKEIDGYVRVREYDGNIDADKIFLCWPPANSSMAFDIVKENDPFKLFYVGQKTNMTGNEEFHSLVEEDYKLIEEVDIPSWPKVKDNFFVYEKV